MWWFGGVGAWACVIGGVVWNALGSGLYRLVGICDVSYEDAGMRATLTIDDDVAAILEERSRLEKKPFERVVNEALRRGTSAATTVAEGRSPNKPFRVKPHKGEFMSGEEGMTPKDVLEELEVEDYFQKLEKR